MTVRAGLTIPVILIPAFVLLFLVYHFFTTSDFFRSYFSRLRDSNKGEVLRVLLMRASFVVLIGLVPLVVLLSAGSLSLRWLRVAPLLSLRSLLWVVGIAGGMSLFALLVRNSPDAQRNYPIIRATRWTPATHAVNVVGWVFYLAAYEFAYRGYILFLTADALGVWPAIAVSVALYAALHIPRGAGEALGCIPMGVVFAVAALHSGTMWVPFLAHFISAVINDLLTFHSNPQFAMVRGGRRSDSGPEA